jgi:intracellular septation protein
MVTGADKAGRPTPARSAPGWLGPAIDFGPLLAFFIAFKLRGPFAGTAVFMIAIAIAVAVSKLRLGRISPMLAISAILVIGFGGLTIWLHDVRFIQVKPTIIYLLLAGVLFGGLFLRRPTLKFVLEHAYDGLSDLGWTKLTRNWAWFFLAMAVLNQALVWLLSFDAWLTVKVWGITVLSVAFAAANIPMLMRHGLGGAAEEAPPVPPQG